MALMIIAKLGEMGRIWGFQPSTWECMEGFGHSRDTMMTSQGLKSIVFTNQKGKSQYQGGVEVYVQCFMQGSVWF